MILKLASLTFVVTYSLDIDGMETFTVDIVMLVFVGSLDSYMRAVHTSDNTGESSSLVKGCLRVADLLLFFWPLDVVLLFRGKCKGYIRDHS